MPGDELVEDELGRVGILVGVRELAAVRLEYPIVWAEKVAPDGRGRSDLAGRHESVEMEAREELDAPVGVDAKVQLEVLGLRVASLGALGMSGGRRAGDRVLQTGVPYVWGDTQTDPQ
jgi:hypothetical protein